MKTMRVRDAKVALKEALEKLETLPDTYPIAFSFNMGGDEMVEMVPMMGHFIIEVEDHSHNKSHLIELMVSSQ